MDPHWQRSSLTLKEIKLNKYDGHFFFLHYKDRFKTMDVRGWKIGGQRERGRARERQRCRDEVNKRGARKEDERFVKRDERKREWRSEREAKGMKNKASDCSGDWLQLVVMIAAGRGGELRVCTGRGLVRAALRGNSSPSRLWKIKEALHSHTHTHMTVPAQPGWQQKKYCAISNYLTRVYRCSSGGRSCSLICVLLTWIERDVVCDCLLVIKCHFVAHSPQQGCKSKGCGDILTLPALCCFNEKP